MRLRETERDRQTDRQTTCAWLSCTQFIHSTDPCGLSHNPLTTVFAQSARSPVYSHLSETLVGVQSVRAFHREQDFINTFCKYQDEHTMRWFMFMCAFRWVAFCMSMIGATFLFIVTFVFTALKEGEFLSFIYAAMVRNLWGKKLQRCHKSTPTAFIVSHYYCIQANDGDSTKGKEDKYLGLVEIAQTWCFCAFLLRPLV